MMKTFLNLSFPTGLFLKLNYDILICWTTKESLEMEVAAWQSQSIIKAKQVTKYGKCNSIL